MFSKSCDVVENRRKIKLSKFSSHFDNSVATVRMLRSDQSA